MNKKHPFLQQVGLADDSVPPPARPNGTRVAVAGDPAVASYAAAALEREVRDVAAAPAGTRNHRLNKAGYYLGQLVAAGHLDHDAVADRLTDAALEAGLSHGEITNVIPRSIEDGGQKPREVPEPTGGVREAFTLEGSAPAVGDDAAVTRRLPNLPDEFWATRPILGRIRQAAHSRCASADVVLHTVLARVASLCHHETTVDTGLGRASLNLLTLAVGPSGTGKSTAVALARELVAVPWSIEAGDGYRDGLPVGTGEGVAEMFMGTTQVDTGEVDRKGDPKLEKRRAQVRYNAYIYVDEGEQLLRMGERSGATIMTTLRSAWVGEVLGQANASEDRTRIIPAGSYAMGVVVGLQPTKAQPLFSDAAGGTPQRCLFAATTDPAVPDEPVAWPGSLTVPNLGMPMALTLVDDEARATLRREHIAANRGELVRAEMDSHEPLHLAKLAGLFAVLDGRREVTGEDWALGRQVWETSREVRDGMRALISAAEEAEANERARRDASRQVMTAVAKADALEDRASAKDDRVLESAARSVARKVRKDGEASARDAARSIAGKHRKAWGAGLVTAAVQWALDRDWITERAGVYVPGLTEPES